MGKELEVTVAAYVTEDGRSRKKKNQIVRVPWIGGWPLTETNKRTVEVLARKQLERRYATKSIVFSVVSVQEV